MQGSVDLSPWMTFEGQYDTAEWHLAHYGDSQPISWVVAGGGPFPIHPDWVRSLRDQCQAAGVPFFFKQWGAYAPAQSDCFRCDPNWVAVDLQGRSRRPAREELLRDDEVLMRKVGKRAAGAMLDGREWREIPE